MLAKETVIETALGETLGCGKDVPVTVAQGLNPFCLLGRATALDVASRWGNLNVAIARQASAHNCLHT